MDHIWDNFLKDKTDKEKIEILRELRKGMSWGAAEHGIPQLSKTVLFLLEIIDKRVKEV